MKSLLLNLLILVGLAFLSCSQPKIKEIECPLSTTMSDYSVVFLDTEFEGEIDFYSLYQRTTLKNDYKREDFDGLLFGLLEKNNQYYKVNAWSSLDETFLGTGLIRTDTPVFIYTRDIEPVDTLVLYKSPSYNSLETRIRKISGDPLPVVDFSENKWLKVKIDEKGEKIEGWIPPENQCFNLYSNCN